MAKTFGQAGAELFNRMNEDRTPEANLAQTVCTNKKCGHKGMYHRSGYPDHTKKSSCTLCPCAQFEKK